MQKEASSSCNAATRLRVQVSENEGKVIVA